MSIIIVLVRSCFGNKKIFNSKRRMHIGEIMIFCSHRSIPSIDLISDGISLARRLRATVGECNPERADN